MPNQASLKMMNIYKVLLCSSCWRNSKVSLQLKHFQNLSLQLFAKPVIDSENSLLMMVARADAYLALVSQRVQLLQLLDHSSKTWSARGFTANVTAETLVCNTGVQELPVALIRAYHMWPWQKKRALILSHIRSGPSWVTGLRSTMMCWPKEMGYTIKTP